MGSSCLLAAAAAAVEISTAKMNAELFPSRLDVNAQVVPRLRICIFLHEISGQAQRECDYVKVSGA